MTQEIWKSWYCLKLHIFILPSSHLLITSKLSSVSLQAAAKPSTSTRKSESVRGAWSGYKWLLYTSESDLSKPNEMDGWWHILASIQKWIRSPIKIWRQWWIGSYTQKEIPVKVFEATETKQIPLLQHRQLRDGVCIEIDEDVTVEIILVEAAAKLDKMFNIHQNVAQREYLAEQGEQRTSFRIQKQTFGALEGSSTSASVSIILPQARWQLWFWIIIISFDHQYFLFSTHQNYRQVFTWSALAAWTISSFTRLLNSSGSLRKCRRYCYSLLHLYSQDWSNP